MHGIMHPTFGGKAAIESGSPIVKFALPNGKELYRKYFNNVNNAVAPEAKRRDCRKKGKGRHGEITYSWRMMGV